MTRDGTLTDRVWSPALKADWCALVSGTEF